ncbi:hypothetical protein [Streptomyces sp. AcH 505]|uniref:hypothetical protein n=1 Tax=Streptomyces sp. AcH 505 TaxID=352211 RepID=UPI0012FEEFEC
MVFKWLQQAFISGVQENSVLPLSGGGEDSPGSSDDQLKREAISDPESVTELIRLEGSRSQAAADAARDEARRVAELEEIRARIAAEAAGAEARRVAELEEQKTTLYIRRLKANVLYGAIGLVVVAGCIVLVLHALKGMHLPLPRGVQAVGSLLGASLLTGVSAWIVPKIRGRRQGSSTGGTPPGGQEAGRDRPRADAP